MLRSNNLQCNTFKKQETEVKLYTCWSITPILPSLQSLVTTFQSLVLWIRLFLMQYLIWVESCSTCLSVSGLFLLAPIFNNNIHLKSVHRMFKKEETKTILLKTHSIRPRVNLTSYCRNKLMFLQRTRASVVLQAWCYTQGML